jgi:hypothetical protein
MTDWLTPETAIGCKLPCGATVVTAYRKNDGDIAVTFDRGPGRHHYKGSYSFKPNGSHYKGLMPNLIPPTPQSGVMVTREALGAALIAAVRDTPFGEQLLPYLADALGIPPDPPKVAPWEAAYEAWQDTPGDGRYLTRDTWQAAVEWCVRQIDEHKRITLGADDIAVLDLTRRRIMGDA